MSELPPNVIPLHGAPDRGISEPYLAHALDNSTRLQRLEQRVEELNNNLLTLIRLLKEHA